MKRTTKRTVRRGAFTLVEMLVVVTIIVILLSLSTAGILSMIDSQRSMNTKSELTRVEDDLVRAYRAASDKFRKEPIPNQGTVMGNVYYNTVLPLAGGDRYRAQVIWVKLRQKQTFPNNFAEAWNPSPMPGLSYYQTKLTNLGYKAGSFPPFQPYQPNQWESSVCLLWALQRGEDSPALKESDFGTGSLKDFGQIAVNPLKPDPSSGLTPNSAQGLPNGTVKGLIDNWGTPLFFNRWPVFSTAVNPGGTAQAGDKNDAEDPSGMLEAPSWEMSGGGFSASANQFMTWCHPLAPHTVGEALTFRVFPLVVSAGPDKQLGLDTTTPPPPPTGAGYFATTSAANAADNLYPTLASPK